MAESLISYLGNAVGSKLFEEGCLLIGVQKEASEIKQKLDSIKAVLKAAEQREVDDGVQQWIRDLKDVAYDIEDVLDDFSIAQLQMQDEAGTSHRGNNSIVELCFSCIPTSCFGFKQAKSRYDIAHTIIEINKRLDAIDERKKKFTFPTAITSSIERPQRDTTVSYGYYAVVDSQKNCKAEVIKKLVDSDFKCSVADHIPIISIVGMGGMGKTTVAQLVYNDGTVKNYFSEKIAWVCVSNNFDAMKVAKDIFRQLRGKSAEESALQSLLTEIENSIRGKKFLLVLDDVWEESEGKWNAIMNCLSKGDTQGSRILMTSRDRNFSRKMGAEIVHVDKLSKTDALLLFSYYAFPGDPDRRGEVEDIAVQLVAKCDGLPLALQVLGSHMADKTSRSQWNDVLSSEMWERPFEEKVFNSLAFSYLELRSQAKRCFAFCSIFPKDTVMKKNDLIRLWMAQGYLQGADQKEVLREEVLGEECFESLLRRSFFRVSNICSFEFGDIVVTMHDIVHDFAQYISNDDVAILDPSNLTKGSTHLRHLAFTREISESECPLSSLKCSALRTLFVDTHKSAPVLDELCSKKSSIRALSMNIYSESETLDGYDMKDIGKLIHLRYVRLGLRNLTALPEEICRLPYLQTLDLTGCCYRQKLPKDLGRLTTLRHLLFSTGYMNSLPKGLGKLSSLQTLSEFICGGLANEDCSSLEDLRDLNNLRGDLWLRNLNSVVNVDEAARASLSKKTHIRQLRLVFGDGDASLQSEVLKALQPAKENLVRLRISEYRGKLCPPWTGQMQYLKKVELEQVGMESLPELGTLRSLEYLLVKEANEVKYVGAEIFGKVREGQSFFPKLESLIFENMANWEHWDGPEEIMRSGATVMPSLRRLRMYNCKALQTLPRFLKHLPLESFKVDSCHLPPVDLAEDEYPKRWRIGDILLPQTLKIIETPYVTLRQEEAPFQPEASQVVQQQHLNFNCVEIGSPYVLSTVTVPGWIMDFAYLRKVTLFKLEDVWLPPLGSLACLEELTICNAEKVEKLGDEFLGISSSNNNKDGDHGGRGASTTPFIVFPKLKELSFEGMPAWREWEDPVHGNNLIIMPSLCKLSITKCEKLKSLPHFFEALVSLKTLRVGATAEGDMPKIRNTTNTGEDEAAYEMSKARSTTTTPAQPELREISLEGVRNEWLLDWAKYCVSLRELLLERCAEASYVGLSEVSLPSLEILEVASCDFRRMGMKILSISSLKELEFSGMSEWEDWDDAPPHQPEIISDESRELSQHGNNTNFTSNLRALSLYRCPKLKALPNFLRSVCTLEELVIVDCDALETWWETEAGEDWRKWISTIPTVRFEPFFERGVLRFRRNQIKWEFRDTTDIESLLHLIDC